MKMKQLDENVRTTKAQMDAAHEVWMDTSVFAPDGPQIKAEKDAACQAYLEALEARQRAGGRGYPTWVEACCERA